jgi:4-hydroxy-4-methyl-2-oxoglutarate aldolase
MKPQDEMPLGNENVSVAPLLVRFARVDTCAVSDALDRAGITGVALGLQPVSGTKRIVGRAVTVQLDVDDGRLRKRHLCTAAVDSSEPSSIIVVAHHGRLDAAGWGGILSLAAKSKGVAGVIVDGACRDVDESREMGLSVFARAPVPITARGRVIETGWNQPVSICGVVVTPGDYVIADGSGVVFVPAARIEHVLAQAERIAAREQLMAKDVLAGRAVADVMGADYESMLNPAALE